MHGVVHLSHNKYDCSIVTPSSHGTYAGWHEHHRLRLDAYLYPVTVDQTILHQVSWLDSSSLWPCMVCICRVPAGRLISLATLYLQINLAQPRKSGHQNDTWNDVAHLWVTNFFICFFDVCSLRSDIWAEVQTPKNLFTIVIDGDQESSWCQQIHVLIDVMFQSSPCFTNTYVHLFTRSLLHM